MHQTINRGFGGDESLLLISSCQVGEAFWIWCGPDGAYGVWTRWLFPRSLCLEVSILIIYAIIILFRCRKFCTDNTTLYYYVVFYVHFIRCFPLKIISLKNEHCRIESSSPEFFFVKDEYVIFVTSYRFSFRFTIPTREGRQIYYNSIPITTSSASKFLYLRPKSHVVPREWLQGWWKYI